MTTFIITYPTGTNPYQHLLYDEFNKYSNIKIHYLNGKIITKYPILLGVPTFYLRLLIYTLTIVLKSKKRIFHLHWISFGLPSNHKLIQVLSFFNTILSVLFIKGLGYKIIWTIHNVLPHQTETYNDLFIARFVSRLAAAKIVHSKSTIKLLEQKQISIKKTFVIPIGSYQTVYKNTITRNQARTFFNISNQYTYLFFGDIQIYKGVDNLIQSFKSLILNKKNIKLIIAGRCWDNKIKNELLALNTSYPNNIILLLNYIEDDKVQYLFNACDIVTLPFKEITTSSSTLLAFSFKKTIITPDISINKELPNDIALKYNPDDSMGLVRLMEYAYLNRKKIEDMNKLAYEYVDCMTWDKIASETYKLYRMI